VSLRSSACVAGGVGVVKKLSVCRWRSRHVSPRKEKVASKERRCTATPIPAARRARLRSQLHTHVAQLSGGSSHAVTASDAVRRPRCGGRVSWHKRASGGRQQVKATIEDQQVKIRGENVSLNLDSRYMMWLG
jgi:hypothetical protein